MFFFNLKIKTQDLVFFLLENEFRLQLDMFLRNMDASSGNKVLHFDPASPHVVVMSVKCEKPIDELTSQFGYCIITQTLNIYTWLISRRNYGQTDGRTDRQTDERTD